MLRLYGLHPWELDAYREDELVVLLRDVKRMENALTQKRR